MTPIPVAVRSKVEVSKRNSSPSTPQQSRVLVEGRCVLNQESIWVVHQPWMLETLAVSLATTVDPLSVSSHGVTLSCLITKQMVAHHNYDVPRSLLVKQEATNVVMSTRSDVTVPLSVVIPAESRIFVLIRIDSTHYCSSNTTVSVSLRGRQVVVDRLMLNPYMSPVIWSWNSPIDPNLNDDIVVRILNTQRPPSESLLLACATYMLAFGSQPARAIGFARLQRHFEALVLSGDASTAVCRFAAEACALSPAALQVLRDRQERLDVVEYAQRVAQRYIAFTKPHRFQVVFRHGEKPWTLTLSPLCALLPMMADPSSSNDDRVQLVEPSSSDPSMKGQRWIEEFVSLHINPHLALRGGWQRRKIEERGWLTTVSCYNSVKRLVCPEFIPTLFAASWTNPYTHETNQTGSHIFGNLFDPCRVPLHVGWKFPLFDSWVTPPGMHEESMDYEETEKDDEATREAIRRGMEAHLCQDDASASRRVLRVKFVEASLRALVITGLTWYNRAGLYEDMQMQPMSSLCYTYDDLNLMRSIVHSARVWWIKDPNRTLRTCREAISVSVEVAAAPGKRFPLRILVVVKPCCVVLEYLACEGHVPPSSSDSSSQADGESLSVVQLSTKDLNDPKALLPCAKLNALLEWHRLQQKSRRNTLTEREWRTFEDGVTHELGVSPEAAAHLRSVVDPFSDPHALSYNAALILGVKINKFE